jgi:META domain
MFLSRRVLKQSVLALALAAAVFKAVPACAEDAFPFGFEMTLDAAHQPGSKRLPTLEIGDSGEAILELWCKGGKGQFSVAGNTVIFVAGPLEDRACPPARAQADDELVASLSEAATWKRQGDLISFIGSKPLRFRLNTN